MQAAYLNLPYCPFFKLHCSSVCGIRKRRVPAPLFEGNTSRNKVLADALPASGPGFPCLDKFSGRDLKPQVILCLLYALENGTIFTPNPFLVLRTVFPIPPNNTVFFYLDLSPSKQCHQQVSSLHIAQRPQGELHVPPKSE